MSSYNDPMTSDAVLMSTNDNDQQNEVICSCVTSIGNKMEIFRNRLIHEEAILSRIPAEIRSNHGSAYEPMIIAIGPYHWINEGKRKGINKDLLTMEEMKLMFLFNLCKRSEENEDVQSWRDILKTYTTVVMEQELRARKKYSESSFEMSSKEFVEMLVLDGCFIVELLIEQAEGAKPTLPITPQRVSTAMIRRDLLLFENQIPLFVLQKIYNETKTHLKSKCFSILQLVLHFLYNKKIVNPGMLPEEYSWYKEDAKEIHHLLHLSHVSLVHQLNPPKVDPHIPESLLDHLFTKSKTCLLSIPRFLIQVLIIRKRSCFRISHHEKKKTEKTRMIPTARKLKEAGVKFRKKVINRGCFIDVSFKDGIIEIPPIRIEEDTESKYRNFLALEQRSMEYGNMFTSYVVFMDNLIDTADDVALLKNKNIIESMLGSEEVVANFFNEIRSGLQFDFNNHYLNNTFDSINSYCNRTYNKWRALLMRKYLNSPWTVISLISVVILLTLTFLQTLFTIKP